MTRYLMGLEVIEAAKYQVHSENAPWKDVCHVVKKQLSTQSTWVHIYIVRQPEGVYYSSIRCRLHFRS